MTQENPDTTSANSWHGVPEVIAHGEPWEIGYAHGSQIPDRIIQCIKNYKTLFHETAETDWTESKERASTYLAALQQNEPDLVDEMRGIAAGAGVGFLDILALNLRSEISLTNYSDGCTSIAAVAGDASMTGSGVYLGQNWDWVGEAATSTAFFDIRKTGRPRIRMIGEAGIVAKFGINDAGVGVCMNAIKCGTVDKSQLPVHLAMRRVLECRSFDEALGMLEKKGVASCVNLMIADRSGKIATIECTPKGLVPVFPEDGSSFVFHTNHLWSPNIPAGIRDHPSKNSFTRLERIKRLSHGEVASMGKIRTWLSDEEGKPASICRYTPPGARGLERMETLLTVIMDIRKSKVEVSFGKPSLSPPVRTIAI
ncbi:uncharacterized protein APUU_11067S [Aspergillus puulaauensis]|uniref:Peptidase C45 hydrolase domain-containing protein n=1 Tax=Aspergillus puulaauensis TaxID=1220207 RepID=A0A7R7XCM0_9EURO|nr:uncharacterized protein APUU_11067S [Aspergillus puulaauensis]BCS18239.1 hypothetical protein APUU_11067S [Aspergillus puulaauensis]